ncbi:MAG: recombination protein RecR [Deltaproteobacteria bacterium]|nr:recombination protein RecR [Deltaproteobacteria bacterium]
MTGYAQPIRQLISELAKFPGIGEKTATRLALYILHTSDDNARKLAHSILEVKEKIHLCSVCFNLTEKEICDICADPLRQKDVVCIVEEPDSLIAIEDSGSFRGTYHTLHGVLSPLDGIGPDHLRIPELLDRLVKNNVKEIIIATNPNVQGEATALLITKLVREMNIKVTRIAFGVPMGGDLKYADRMTLAKSLEFRRII